MYDTDRAHGHSFQHDCLRIPADMREDNGEYQIIDYCTTEWLSPPSAEDDYLPNKLTFLALHNDNVTSEQLYLWSAPIDVVEQYQAYLNHLATSNELSPLAAEVYYNCTLPRFGPRCQYALDIVESTTELSLEELVHRFYRQYYFPTTLTCYMHLECHRDGKYGCLDWTEICDQIVDCRGGIDEQLCVQLNSDACEAHEYQCSNGQCIDHVFWHDAGSSFECLDKSDEFWRTLQVSTNVTPSRMEPTFASEDIACLRRRFDDGTPLTSSCHLSRNVLMERSLWADRTDSLRETCQTAVSCELRNAQPIDAQCRNLCHEDSCLQAINASCPDMFRAPVGALVFGHMFFVYTKTDMLQRRVRPPAPRYICYDDRLCDGFLENRSVITFENATCRQPADIPLKFASPLLSRSKWRYMYYIPLTKLHKRCNRISQNYSASCSRPTAYHCRNSSQCIGRYEICDGVVDCDHGEDEQCAAVNGSCTVLGTTHLFLCQKMNICITPLFLEDGFCQCTPDEYDLCEDEQPDLNYRRKHVSFTTVCDGFTELIPVTIDGSQHTDETECDYWRCNNTYTRCDGFWNCLDGADEVDCAPSPYANCSTGHHVCVTPNATDMICLPLSKANDGVIDCLGATDEPKRCRSRNHLPSDMNFYCTTRDGELCTDFSNLCTVNECTDRAYEYFCYADDSSSNPSPFCGASDPLPWPPSKHYLCERPPDEYKSQSVHFALKTHAERTSVVLPPSVTKHATKRSYAQLCHRGLVLHAWLEKNPNASSIHCLCPPSYYGNRCQYQNQRVSLTIRLQTPSDSWRTLFALTVALVDDSNERIVHSYQRFDYLYVRHCRVKFNIYLLYAVRAKDLTRNYSVHIDVHEKASLSLRGSLRIPIKDLFLPVNRLAVELRLPRIHDEAHTCSDPQCVHGRCVKYSNDQTTTGSFCRCQTGWTGKHCDIPHACTCSSDSICLGVSASNRSICVCPTGKWGPRCLLQSTICRSGENGTCEHGGRCIPLDENLMSGVSFLCLCPKGFAGDRCQIPPTLISISFHRDISLSQTVLIHFIRAIDGHQPEHGMTFADTILTRQPIVVRWARPFHIVFAETTKNSYYLLIVQKTYAQSASLSTNVNRADRCPHISKLLGNSVVGLHLLRRIKFYHLPCQRRRPMVSCFYDSDYFCFCYEFGQQRLANCFEFNSSAKYDCFGQSACENDGHCFQDNATCPQTAVCACPKCFYGTRCQFSSDGFDLSLDAIIGYHIQTNVPFSKQPALVKVSVALSTTISVLGLTNSVLSLLTFMHAEAREVGSGCYLAASSIATLLVTVMFTLKFSILLLAQMTHVTDDLFLTIQCRSVDFLLQIGLQMNTWLNSFVAAERALATIKGVLFERNKSKRMAKYAVLAVTFFITCTSLHDPIHRRLLVEESDDGDGDRTWCIASYSPRLRLFNSCMLMLHFFAPFLINIVSAIIIIVITARQRKKLHARKSYQSILKQQAQKLKHLLIAPLAMVGLALPRLIISLVGGCMKSINEPWLYLTGYLISFVPSTLTFVIFVLPSGSYTQIFCKTFAMYRRKT